MDACSGASVASRHCEYPDLGSGPERGGRRQGSEGWTVKAVDMEPSQAPSWPCGSLPLYSIRLSHF